MSLLAGAVLGALSLPVQNVHAVTVSEPVSVNEKWQAFQITEDKGGDYDLYTNQLLIQESGKPTVQIDQTFTQADFEDLKRVEGFGEFGTVGVEGDGQPGIQVSSVNGLFVNGKDTTLTVNNASIKLRAETIAGNPYVEVTGVNHREGEATYEGKTDIQVSSDTVMDSEEESFVGGYMIENPLDFAQSQRVVSFNGETNISASATNANGLDVIGFSLAADAKDNPVVNFAGTTTISSSNAADDRVSFALWMHNSDGNLGEESSVTVAGESSLTLNAEGGVARGLFVDHGSFVSHGTLHVNAEADNGNVVVAIYAADDGKLRFNGTTVATASGSADAYALYIGAGDYSDEDEGKGESETVSQPTVEFSEGSQTTLNGSVFVDRGMTVTMNGTTTVNGALELSGTIDGTGSLTIDAKQATGTIAEGATISQGSLTFANGSFENNGEINVTGDVTLNNVTFTNTVKNDVEVRGRVTLGNGTTLINHGGFHSNDWVLSSGSVYQEEASELGADGIMQMDSGRFELAGGTFGIIGNAATVNGWLVAPDSEEPGAAPELVFSAGNYEYDRITVNAASAGDKSALAVTGGSVTLDSLTIEQGAATISGGTVDVNTLTVDVANGLTIGGTDGTASLTVNHKITDVASGIIIGVNGTLATNVGTIGFKDLDEGYEVSDDFNTVSVTAGGTMRVEGFDGVSLSIGELAQLKNKLAGSDSQGLLDLVGDIEITDLTISDGKVTASAVENLGNTTTSALKEATVTEVGNSGVTGSFKAVELAEGTNKLSVTSSSGALTLNGSAEGGNLVTKGSGETATAADISVTDQVATIGNAEAANKGTVSGVTLNEGATVNVVGTAGATFSLGTVTTTDSASGENVVNVLGAKAEAEEIGGSVAVNVGSSDVAGHVEVEKLTTSGLIFLDPAWKGDDKIEDGSFLTAADVDTDGKLNAKIVVGQNSTVAVGATKDEVVESFAQTGLHYGADGVTAVFYAQKAIRLSDTGAILVNGELTEAPDDVTAGSFHVTKNGLAVIDGDAIVGDTAAITASTITFEEGSHVRVVGLGEDKMSGTLFKATSALNIDDSVIEDAKTNSGIYSLEIKENGSFTATEVAAADAFPTFYGTEFLEKLRTVGLDEDAADTTQAFLSRLNYHDGMTAAEASDIGNQAMALAATSGVYNVALDASKLMSRSLDRRMTLADNFDRSKGVTVWADVFGTTNEAESLYGDGGYDMDLYGGVLGADVEVVPDAILGAALTVGTGDGGSKSAAIDVDNDADFVGLSVYGSHRIGNCNGMIDIGWMHTKSDLSATAFGMSIGDEVKADAFTIGLGAEHLMKFGSVNVVPHVGIRWTRLDVDGYEGAFKTDDDTMNIFTLPIGVAFSGNLNAGGWKLAPMVDLAVVPSFGDDEAESKVRWQGVSETVKTQVVDDAPFQASLGINAQNGNWTIGASYDLGVGGDDRLDNAFTVRARYAF